MTRLVALGGLLAWASVASAASLTAEWTAPVTNVDGSPLTDLASYRVYVAAPGPPCPALSYVVVPAPSAAPAPGTTVRTVLTNLTPMTLYHVQVTALDATGNESPCSNVVSQTTAADRPPGNATGLTLRIIPDPPTPPTETFRASADFGSVQGFRGWFYRNSDGTAMTFDGTVWRGPEQYLILSNDGGHPGMVRDAVRRWVAPRAGSVRISGRAADTHTTCGVGAAVYIRKGATTLWQSAIANGNTAGVAFDVLTTVLAGEAIDFVINRGADNSWACDTTLFNPEIVLSR